MRVIDSRRRDSERAVRLRTKALALFGVWLLNLFLFLVGFTLVFSSGAPVPEGRRDQPRVFASKGDYRQFRAPAYAYLVGHERVTLILTVIVLPFACLEIARLMAGRDGVQRGAV